MKPIVSISVNQNTLDKIRDFYSDFIVPNDGEYIYFFANVNGVVVTGFSGKKEKKTVTFQGDNALKEARIWDKNAQLIKPKTKEKEEWLCLEDQIGSDEVGVGDFVLPMIVVAAFVRKKDIKTLLNFGIHDSKKLKDEDILEIGKALTKKVFISRLVLHNDKYNEMIDKGENINSLKAKMHNRALLNLYKQFPDVKNIFVDQFVKSDTYYRYLNDENEVKVENITFKTKGESSYPSVALASVMARYAFLLEKQRLEEHYKMTFPFGAGTKADEFSKEFVKKYGLKEFEKICKKNFSNYQEITKIDLL